MTQPSSDSLTLIGWREWMSFPDLGIPALKVKVDTGARSSAIHTHDYEVYQTSEGIDRVRFHLHPIRTRDDIELECDAKVIGFRSVKDSGGHEEKRPFIETTAKLGSISWPIQLSLTNREGMLFRMLLGRVALEDGRLAVDPSSSYRESHNLVGIYDGKPFRSE